MTDALYIAWLVFPMIAPALAAVGLHRGLIKESLVWGFIAAGVVCWLAGWLASFLMLRTGGVFYTPGVLTQISVGGVIALIGAAVLAFLLNGRRKLAAIGLAAYPAALLGSFALIG